MKKYLLAIFFIGLASIARSQAVPADTTTRPVMEPIVMDDSLDYEDLLNDLDIFLDSILAPRSYLLLSLSGAQGYVNFTNKNNTKTRELKKIIWSPTLGYYDKSGLGILFNSYMLNDSGRRYWYQASITPSYDYIKDRHLATGVAFTKYFTKRAIPFYSTPIQNELSAYFLWRKSWLQPGVMASVGWGNHTEFSRRDTAYRKLVTANTNTRDIPVWQVITIIQKNEESIRDFTVAGSLQHDFYWIEVFSKKDFIRLSPIIYLTGGTQKFGLNQTTGAFGPVRAVVLNTESASLVQKFRLLSTTFCLRGEFGIGKFFIGPQLLIDYYFPDGSRHLTTSFSFTTGFMF